MQSSCWTVPSGSECTSASTGHQQEVGTPEQFSKGMGDVIHVTALNASKLWSDRPEGGCLAACDDVEVASVNAKFARGAGVGSYSEGWLAMRRCLRLGIALLDAEPD